MTRHEIETRRERKLQARYVMRDGKRVLEPPEVTVARNAKLNDERMPCRSLSQRCGCGRAWRE